MSLLAVLILSVVVTGALVGLGFFATSLMRRIRQLENFRKAATSIAQSESSPDLETACRLREAEIRLDELERPAPQAPLEPEQGIAPETKQKIQQYLLEEMRKYLHQEALKLRDSQIESLEREAAHRYGDAIDKKITEAYQRLIPLALKQVVTNRDFIENIVTAINSLQVKPKPGE